jgi:hypothetical protein
MAMVLLLFSANPIGTSSIGDIFATAVNSTVNTFSNFEMYIPNYLDSTNKSVSIDTTNENNATSQLVFTCCWLMV